MSQKPTAGRIILPNANKSLTSSTLVQARLPDRRTSSPRARFASNGAITVLLLSAGLGVVFSLKHRPARQVEPVPAALPQTIALARADVAPNDKPPAPLPRSDKPARRAVPNKKTIPATPAIKQPEQLTVLPRTIPDDPNVDDDEAEPEPMGARTEKPLEPTVAPKESPIPAENLENARPDNDAAAKLAPTDPPAKIGRKQMEPAPK